LEARLLVSVGSGSHRFSLDCELLLEQGVLILFGPSGAGKSLTLQTLAGLVRPERGSIRLAGAMLFDDREGIDVPAHRRHVGYVPQHHVLFPFRSVIENVMFGLPRVERRRDNPRVRELMEELGIARLAGARPHALSGGERQRVALARALAVRPRLLLLDEPFASIDESGRAGLRRLLRSVLDHHRIPTVFVTHNPDEALELGDTLVQLERGRTVASGPPATLLQNGHGVTLTGRANEPPQRLNEARSRLALASATVDAPNELLRVDADGLIRLNLNVRSSSPESANGDKRRS